MPEIWIVQNNNENWLVQIGDQVQFKEYVTSLQETTIVVGVLDGPVRPNRHGVVSHKKVARKDTGRRQLVAIRDIISIQGRNSILDAGS
jgi:hypothetical protein